jgi:RNA polymerase sigma factor (sigma-70 family)
VATILQRISAGDEHAVDEYGDLIWRLASRYLDRVKTDIEDAVQEVFVELWQHAGRFDPEKGSEPAFVATLAHRRLMDYQRRLKSRPNPAGDSVSEATRAEVPASLQIEVKRIDAQRAAAEFDRLPDDERSALWMSIYGAA